VNKESKENIENKQSFLLGFYFNEARLLKEFLIHALQSVFKTQEVEAIKKFKNSKGNQESNKSNAEEDGELW
jgi:hypothetical protein